MSHHRLFLLLLSAALLTGGSPLWAQRNLKEIPDPDPELERASFIVADGFEVNLYAADPKIAKPIQMNFDAAGRLWIASSEVYPHVKPGQQANDKILVIEDRNGDGEADQTTVFADGLLIPTGVAPGDGGAYVANSTELIHLADTDQDGKADKRTVVLSGFGTEDTHHLLHTLRWGPDGALYMNQSIYIHSHIETPHGVRTLNGGGIWRFRPESLELSVLCRGFVNPWGHHFDRWGQSFATDGAYGEGINYVFPGAIFATAPGEPRRLRGLNPGSPKHCGLEIASGRHLPPSWNGDMLTNDFRAHRVCRFVVSENGSGYASRQETELIKTTHAAFRPIDVKMGPDGAIYIADWYNPIIQHGEVDFRDPRRDHTHGRIWRVTYKDRPLLPLTNVATAGIDELLEHLKAPENWVRQNAKLKLRARGAAAVSEPLLEWLTLLEPTDPQYEHHRLEALWTYQGIGQKSPTLLKELLQSKDHRVRAAAVRVLSLWKEDIPQVVDTLASAARDEHPRVRLEAVRALADMQSAAAAEYALRVFEQPMDRFLDFALWQAMRDLKPYWLAAVEQGKFDLSDANKLAFAAQAADAAQLAPILLKQIAAQETPAERRLALLGVIASLGGPDELGQVFTMIVKHAEESPKQQASLLTTLVETTTKRKTRPNADVDKLSLLLKLNDPAMTIAAVHAAGAWRVESLRTDIESRAKAEDASPAREAAIVALTRFGGAKSIAALTEIASTHADWPAKAQAAAALAPLDSGKAAVLTVGILEAAPEGADPSDLISSILSRKQGAAQLTEAIVDHRLRPDVAKLAIRAAQNAAQQSPPLVEALRAAGSLTESGWNSLTPESITELVDAVAQQGDPAAGELIYRRAQMRCQTCHAIGGAGGRVGPDLVSIGGSAPVDYLLDSLVFPNKKIKENYHAQSIVTDAGKIISGIPVRESATQLFLRDNNDQEIAIAIDSIEVRREGRSLMPDGAVDVLTRKELIDLTRFLSELGKGDYAVGKDRVARRWERLVWTQEAHRRLNRSSFNTAASDDPAFTWEPSYSTVAGSLPIADLAGFSPFNGIAPTGVVRCEIEVTAAGIVGFQLDVTEGMSCWIDGKPIPIEAKLAVPLKKGRHRLTFTINKTVQQENLRLELFDVGNSNAQADWVTGK